MWIMVKMFVSLGMSLFNEFNGKSLWILIRKNEIFDYGFFFINEIQFAEHLIKLVKFN